MKHGYFILSVLLTFTLYAQTNLVPNPSFEDYFNCPQYNWDVTTRPDSFWSIGLWYSPSAANPDYFNVCAAPDNYGIPVNVWGSQWPRTGNGYMGFTPFVGYSNFDFEYREYVATKLFSPLIKNFAYEVQLHVSSAEVNGNSQEYVSDISTIGACFTSFPLRDFPMYGELPYSAQVQNPASVFLDDQQHWTEVKNTFRASGGEQWITIGNFAPKYATPFQLRTTDTLISTHSYYYLDDVSVKLVEVNNNRTDTSLCSGNSLMYPPVPYSDSCRWNDGQTGLQRTFSGSGKWWVTYYNIDELFTATDTLNLTVHPPEGTRKDTAMCTGRPMLLEAGPATAYEWSTGSTAPGLMAFTAGTYWVKRTSNGCFTIDTFVIRALDCSLLPPGKLLDTIVCQGASVLIPEQPYPGRGVWNDGDTVQQRIFRNQGKWWITYYVDGYALSADTLILELLPVSGTNRDTLICQGQQLVLDAGNATSYLWNTGSSDSAIATTDTGTFWVKKYVNSCISTDTFRLARLAFPSLPAFADTAFCAGDSLLIGHSQAGGYRFTWYPSLHTSPGITVSTAGIYVLQTDSAACSAYDTLSVHRHENPRISLDPDTVVCFGDLQRIELDAGEFNTYLWQPTGETTRSVYATQAMIYQLTVTDTNGCRSRQLVQVDEACTSQLFFPNVFTPNNDGQNDVYEIGSIRQYTQSFRMQVFNRWGVCVFSTGNVYETWDGTMDRVAQPDDVYVLVAGYRLGGRQHEVKMWITLIR